MKHRCGSVVNERVRHLWTVQVNDRWSQTSIFGEIRTLYLQDHLSTYHVQTLTSGT